MINGLYSRVVRTYDDCGRQTGEDYFDTAGRPVLQGFIHDWLVLAPIPFGSAADGSAALAREQIPNEAGLQPREGEGITLDGKELLWTNHRAAGFQLDFNQFVGRSSDVSVAYAVCYIMADADMLGLSLKVGSDDGAKVFLNGREVLNQPGNRTLTIDEHAIPDIALARGTNVLVIKVANRSGYWSACVRFADAAGNPVTNLKIALSPE